MIRSGIRRGGRKLLWLFILLSSGILANHQSCSMATRDGVTGGVTRFFSDLTLDTLNGFLRPGVTGSSDTSAGQNGGDPFAPPGADLSRGWSVIVLQPKETAKRQKKKRSTCAFLLFPFCFFLPALMGCPESGNGTTGGGPQLVFRGLNAALLSVSGTSSQNVYAVGADPDDGLGPYVLHYNGQRWRRIPSGLTGHLWWISVAPIDGAFYLAGAGGKVVRFDPSSAVFERLDTPGEETLFGVWGTASSALWVVGGDPAVEGSGVIWRYDGAGWTMADLSSVVPEGLPTLYKVWGRSAQDVYAVGQGGLVLHFDGSSWSRLASDTTATLITVHGNAEQMIAVGGLAEGLILEPSGNAFANTAPAGTAQVIGVFVPPSGPPVSVGAAAAVLLREPGGWRLQDYALNTTRDFHTVWVDPAGGIWAVGGDLSVNLEDGILAYIGPETISTDVNIRR